MFPASSDARIVLIPMDPFHPDATNGTGLQMAVPSGRFITVNGPAILVKSEPLWLSIWYRTDLSSMQLALGAFAETAGQPGAASYTLRTKPEIANDTWQKTTLMIGAGFTKVIPFLALYNASGAQAGTIYFDNLTVDQGVTENPGGSVGPLTWQPNLWLLDSEKGTAEIQNGVLILDKNDQQKASRFVASYAQITFPNQVTVEADIGKDFGDSGAVTLWVGNGPSAFQTEIPLWILTPGQIRTVRLSGITSRNSGPMNIVIQIAGEDNERIHVPAVRVYEK